MTIFVLITLIPALFKGTFNLLLRGNEYLDPGSGSFILQLILASLLGFLFILKTYWQKLLRIFRRLFSKSNNEQEE